ncbi:MAG: hypothetical protein GY759_21445 [Chloroflexi bacterium]|nr:hypothetical protein [Chloroflexota bacterium]
MDPTPIHFIGEQIEVEFEAAPVFEKDPGCPDRFLWREQVYTIEELISEWRDYGRRGRMADNMRPENAAKAAVRGSWGVGRIYFRVRVHTGQFFDLYYDRAPRKQERKGSWYLYRELNWQDG